MQARLKAGRPAKAWSPATARTQATAKDTCNGVHGHKQQQERRKMYGRLGRHQSRNENISKVKGNSCCRHLQQQDRKQQQGLCNTEKFL